MVYFMIRFTEEEGKMILEADALKREDATVNESIAQLRVEEFLRKAIERGGNFVDSIRPRTDFPSA